MVPRCRPPKASRRDRHEHDGRSRPLRVLGRLRPLRNGIRLERVRIVWVPPNVLLLGHTHMEVHHDEGRRFVLHHREQHHLRRARHRDRGQQHQRQLDQRELGRHLLLVQRDRRGLQLHRVDGQQRLHVLALPYGHPGEDALPVRRHRHHANPFRDIRVRARDGLRA